MAWTKEATLKFQMSNKEYLDKVNTTLRPDKNLHGKVGIFAQGQLGDLATCMSVLKYRDIVFPGKEIIWYVNAPNADLLRYSHISEVRAWPWAGAGLPEGTADFFPLLSDENNRLNKELAKNYELTADLEDGYFPCAWMRSPKQRHGLEYPEISKRIFGLPDKIEWHPVLHFSLDEVADAANLMIDLPRGKRVCLETFAGSGQSIMSDTQIRETMQICESTFGNCNFIFVSDKYLKGNEQFPEDILNQANTFFCGSFTVRQCVLIVEQCDIMISVSSGISVVSSCWGSKAVPTLQYTGSSICSTQKLSKGRFELVTHDNKPLEVAQEEYYSKLRSLLNEIK